MWGVCGCYVDASGMTIKWQKGFIALLWYNQKKVLKVDWDIGVYISSLKWTLSICRYIILYQVEVVTHSEEYDLLPLTATCWCLVSFVFTRFLISLGFDFKTIHHNSMCYVSSQISRIAICLIQVLDKVRFSEIDKVSVEREAAVVLSMNWLQTQCWVHGGWLEVSSVCGVQVQVAEDAEPEPWQEGGL